MAEYDIVDNSDYAEIIVPVPQSVRTKDGVVALSAISAVFIADDEDAGSLALVAVADGREYTVKSWDTPDAVSYVKAVKKAQRKGRKLQEILGWEAVTL